jgi:V/A-type H+/Na+-transporting ATPase subunit I
MSRPAKIYHTTVILKEDRVDELIKKIYELGLCELKESSADLSSKYSYEIFKNLDDIQTRFNFIIDSLEEYKEIIQPENRIKQLWSPDAPKKHKSMVHSTEEIIEEVEYHLGLIEPKILERLNRLQKIKDQIQENKFTISNLSLIPDVKTNMFKSSDNIKVFTGLVTIDSFPKIKSELISKAVVSAEKSGKTQFFLTIFSSLQEAQPIEKILHSVGFETLSIPYEDKNPTEIIANLKNEIEKLENERAKINNFFIKTRKVYDKKFALLSEELEIARQKLLALKNFKTTKAFSVLDAWVPEKDFETFQNTVKEISKQYYIEIDEKDDSPTLFNNSKWVQPFEIITNLYSPPKYKDFDPTILIAITFTLFFGFMLTDVAYGILLLLLGVVMYRGIGKYNETSKRFATLLIFFGISTTMLGMVFGSYFGDFFQKMGINMPMLIDPMKQVMVVLVISLGLGAIHLVTGLVIGFTENIRKRKVKDAFAQQGVWMFFTIGLLLVLVKQMIPAYIAMGIAVALQLIFNFMEGGVVISILSIFNFTGFVGDLFSYARLMALALGTAGIALAVNFIIALAVGSVPYVGIIFGIVIFIGGHLFNLLMNGLGAFVHTTRLHFLELFTKFYEGGGRLYKPFKAERKNTYI